MNRIQNAWQNINVRVMFLHVFFWVIYFSYRYYDLSKHFGSTNTILLVGFPMLLFIMVSYTHYFLLLPTLVKKKQYVSYALQLIVLLSIGIIIRGLLEKDVYTFYDRSDYYETIHFSRVMSISWDYLSFILFTSMIKFTMDRFILENEKKTLINEKLTAELNYLKAQINPHFLFNTLHNLNYLINKKPDTASEIIIKLSDMMRYMIYEANKEYVPLSQEIEYSKNYIELEAVRFNHPLDVSWHIDGDTSNVKTIPLLLITLVENAVKHGLSDSNPSAYVKIAIEVSPEMINLKTVNLIVGQTKQEGSPSGFGLKNMQKRLELAYGINAKLTVREDGEHFHTDLKIRLE